MLAASCNLSDLGESNVDGHVLNSVPAVYQQMLCPVNCTSANPLMAMGVSECDSVQQHSPHPVLGPPDSL